MLQSALDLPGSYLAAWVEMLAVELDLAVKVAEVSMLLPATAGKPREGPSLSSRAQAPPREGALGFAVPGAQAAAAGCLSPAEPRQPEAPVK